MFYACRTAHGVTEYIGSSSPASVGTSPRNMAQLGQWYSEHTHKDKIGDSLGIFWLFENPVIWQFRCEHGTAIKSDKDFTL